MRKALIVYQRGELHILAFSFPSLAADLDMSYINLCRSLGPDAHPAGLFRIQDRTSTAPIDIVAASVQAIIVLIRLPHIGRRPDRRHV